MPKFDYALVSFLFEFVAATIIAAVVIAVIVAVVVPRLEFLVVPLVIVVIAIIIAKRISPVVSIAFATLVGAETLDKGSIGEFELSRRETGQLLLNGVVVNGLLMPVVVGQFHVIGHGIGKTIALVGIFFGQRLVDDDLQVFAQMREFGVTLGVFQWLRTRPQRFPGRDGIGRGYFQFEIGDQKKVIP
jgi:hypothetical protein